MGMMHGGVMRHMVHVVMVVVMVAVMHDAMMDHLGLGAAGRHERRQRQAENQGQGSDPATAPG